MTFRTLVKQIPTGILFATILAVLLEPVKSAGHTLFQDVAGIIRSPNFPRGYPNNYHHFWEIRVSPELEIELIFDSFLLENCADCLRCDYVAIYDGERMDGSRFGIFCRDDTLSTMVSSTNVIHIEMKTDGSAVTRGFSARYTTTLNMKAHVPKDTERNLTQYFLSTIQKQTQNINKWGKELTRSALALFLHDPGFFAPGNHTGEAIAYELSLQLMSKLVMKKQITTNDLALFINAMTVACINPRKFFGVNLVDELINRVDNNNHTNPFLILAICNGGGSIKAEYVHKLQQLFETPLRPSWAGTQAVVVMALKCISRQTDINLNTTLTKMVSELKRKQQNNGAVENLKTTALVIQALMATENYRTDFNLSMAIKYIVQDMKYAQLSTEKMYYILPIFRWKTLLNITSNHCGSFIKTDLQEMKIETNEKEDEQLEVQISIIIGDDMDFSRTWRINVSSDYSLYQVLENVTSSNPDYMIQYTIVEGKPYIAGLASFEDSIEDGLFWFIYKKPLSSTGDLILLEDSPIDILVSDTDELILWYNSGSPPSIQYTGTDTTDVNSIMDTTDTDAMMSNVYSDNTDVDFSGDGSRHEYTTWESIAFDEY